MVVKTNQFFRVDVTLQVQQVDTPVFIANLRLVLSNLLVHGTIAEERQQEEA